MTLHPAETTQKALISTTSHFVGQYERGGVMLTHAWPDLRDVSTTDRWSEGPASRQAFVFVFETPSIQKGPGVPLPDYSAAGEWICSCCAVLFGKRFDSHGLTEGSGLFYIPDLTHFGQLCNHRIPFNSHSSRVDAAVPLNLTELSRIEPLLLGESSADSKFLTTFRGAAKFYSRALQVAEADAEVAYLHLITAGEILSNFRTFAKEELLDDCMREILDKIRGTLSDGDAVANLIASRLRQVKRRFVETIVGLVDELFFQRSESRQLTCQFKADSFREAISGAYDLRSLYVHTGIPFGRWVSWGMGSANNEVSFGSPVVGDKDLERILAKAPTLVGLERVIRYCLLRFAQSHGAYIDPASKPLEPGSTVPGPNP